MIVESIGNFVPKGGIPFHHEAFEEVTLIEDVEKFIPTIYAKAKGGVEFLEAQHLSDGTKFELAIAGKRLPSEREKSVTLDFVLRPIKITQAEQDGTGMVFEFAFELDVDGLHGHKNRAFKDKTSGEVLAELAKEMKLEFEDLTEGRLKDRMTWVQNGTNYEFVNELVSHAFAGLDNGVVAYIDLTRTLVVADLSAVLGKKATGKNLVHLPASFGSDKPTKTEDKHEIIPFIGWGIKSLSGLSGPMGGYGLEVVEWTGKKHITEVVRGKSSMTNAKQNDVAGMSKADFGKSTGYHYSVRSRNAHEHYSVAPIYNRIFLDSCFSEQLDVTINSSPKHIPLESVNVIFAMGGHVNTIQPNNIYGGVWFVKARRQTFGGKGGATTKLILTRPEHKLPPSTPKTDKQVNEVKK